MDYKEEINKAAKYFADTYFVNNKESFESTFINGALSQAAKDYWYNEFKRERTPIKLTDQEKLDIEYGITPLGRQHRQYLKDNPDKPMSFDDWKYMVESYEKPELISKEDIIDHVDNGKSIKCVIVGVGSQMLIPEERFEVMENLKPDLSAIKSIVPIADVIPEEIISKQEFLEMHDKAVERSITEETYKESRAWDIKKEKKVSHKRNNKRK